jgi:hypothetical protein
MSSTYSRLNREQSDIDIDKIGIANATSRLPKTVGEAYNRILSNSHDPKKARRILHIVEQQYGL